MQIANTRQTQSIHAFFNATNWITRSFVCSIFSSLFKMFTFVGIDSWASFFPLFGTSKILSIFIVVAVWTEQMRPESNRCEKKCNNVCEDGTEMQICAFYIAMPYGVRCNVWCVMFIRFVHTLNHECHPIIVHVVSYAVAPSTSWLLVLHLIMC